MSPIALLCFGVVFVGLFNQGSSINCYSCSNAKDCNDDLVYNSPDVTQIDTIGGDDCLYCTKQKTIAFGAQSVSRSCVANDDTTYELGCFSEDLDAGGEVEVCYCDGALCNHSNQALASVLVMSLAILLLSLI